VQSLGGGLGSPDDLIRQVCARVGWFKDGATGSGYALMRPSGMLRRGKRGGRAVPGSGAKPGRSRMTAAAWTEAKVSDAAYASLLA